MTNEQLAGRIKAGQADLSLELWHQVERLVRKIMLRYLPVDGSSAKAELDDMMQAGFLAMLQAVKYFDPLTGWSFSTYLNFTLKNAAREVLGIRKKIDPLIEAKSLDKPLADGEVGTLADVIADERTETLYDDLVTDLSDRADVAAILRELEAMDPDGKVMFVEHYAGRRSVKDIAQAYGRPVKDIRAGLTRTMRKVKYCRTFRRMLDEKRLDWRTSFYRPAGVSSFATSWTSSTESVVIQRELDRLAMERRRNGED